MTKECLPWKIQTDIPRAKIGLEGSSEKIIHRLKNPEVFNPITRGEAPSDWIGKTEGFFNL